MNDANQLTLEMLMPEDCQTLTPSFSDGLAKIIRLLESEMDSGKALEAAYSLKQLESCGLKSPSILSLKTSKDFFPSMTESTSTKQFDCSPTWGMTVNGKYLIQGGFYPKIESGYFLSDMLEDNPDPKYFLSEQIKKRMATYQDYKIVSIASQQGITGRKQSGRMLLKVNSMRKSINDQEEITMAESIL